MVHDPQFWVALSFVLFIAAVFKPIGKIIGTILDDRSAKIQKDLNEAMHLKEEAQKLLASYQRKQKEIAEEARRIVSNAENEAKLITMEAERNLEENINKKIQIAIQKISTYEHAVINEIRTNSIDIAVNTVRHLVKENMSNDVSERFVKRAIGEMDRILN